jgi:hypothetical protein
VIARHTRLRASESDGWACMFTVVASGNADLAVVHRLSAPTLAEARRSVRHAVEFLAGRAGANPAGSGARSDLNRTAESGFPRLVGRAPADQLPAPLS